MSLLHLFCVFFSLLTAILTPLVSCNSYIVVVETEIGMSLILNWFRNTISDILQVRLEDNPVVCPANAFDSRLRGD